MLNYYYLHLHNLLFEVHLITHNKLYIFCYLNFFNFDSIKLPILNFYMKSF